MAVTPVDQRETYTLPEVAAKLGVHPNHVARLVRDDKFPVPVIHLGRRVVVSKRVLERYLEGLAS